MSGKSTRGGDRRARSSRESPLGWLGHRIVRHPWYAIMLWVVILVVCIVPAINVGSVITNNFTNPLPSSDESVRAQNAFSAAFPDQQSSPSSAIVLLESPNIVNADGKNATLALTSALSSDPHLKNVSSVESLYSAYSAFLAGQVKLGWAFLGPALSASPSLPASLNVTATALWAPVGSYLPNWEAIVANQTNGTPKSAADWPAYNETRTEFVSSSAELLVLTDFFNGSAAGPGFDAAVRSNCLATGTPSSCATRAARDSLPAVFPTLFPSPAAAGMARLVLSDLDVGNWSQTASQQGVAAISLGTATGIAPSWILTIWQAFPGSEPPSTAAVGAWVAAQVEGDSLQSLPLPVPTQILGGFVNAQGTATLIIVSFNVDDSYTVNGSSVTYNDVSEIDHLVTQVLGSSAAYFPITSYVTGGAPLDDSVNTLATSALSVLLVLTIIVLLVIMMLFFRAPAAPALAFGMIGIALLAGFAAIFVVGTFVTKFVSEIESIVLVFLMAIGTDYSVFLLARYREELVNGADPNDAVATTVRWAGQSILTSGLAVMVVALALTLSNISFLTQLGICLLISVAFALAVNLTVLPSILRLVGPRIFWPNSGERFSRYAMRRTENLRLHRDYVGRAGRAATRRPILVISLILLLSIPVVAVAVQVPVSYDIENIGLPPSNSAQRGFVQLQNDFGASYSSTSYALVTFSAPLVTNSQPNVQEFQDVAGLAQTMSATPGVAAAETLVGPGGAPLDTWLNYSALPPAIVVALNATLHSYIGTDGKTVLFNIATNASGFSAPAISVLNNLEQRVSTYDATHPGVSQTLYGGAAPTTRDIRSLVNTATEEMLIGAAVGLFILMLLILGSAFVPLLALGVIGLSILWSWATTYFVVGILEGEALIFLLPLILLILTMGLGMDYNVLLLTRVKEERTLGRHGVDAIRDAVTHAGGVILAAAVILGGAFLLLGFTSPLGLIAALGLGIGTAVLLQAFVVQLFFTPAVLTVGKDWIWKGGRRSS